MSIPLTPLFNVTGGLISNIACNGSANVLVAAVYSLGVYRSIDSGYTWSVLNAKDGEGQQFANVWSDTSGKYLLAGSYAGTIGDNTGTLFTSNDYGSSWTTASSVPLSGYIYFAGSYSGQYQYVSSPSTGYFTSTDYGSSWNQGAVNVTFGPMASSSTGQYLVATCIDCPLYLSSDYGNSFSINKKVPIAKLTNQTTFLTSDHTGNYLTYTYTGGNFYTSKNRGSSWSIGSFTTTPATAYTNNAWSSVASSYSGAYVVVATSEQAGYLFYSANYGVSFNQVASAPQGSWTVVLAAGSGYNGAMIAVQANQYLYYSQNFGSSFFVETTMPSQEPTYSPTNNAFTSLTATVSGVDGGSLAAILFFVLLCCFGTTFFLITRFEEDVKTYFEQEEAKMKKGAAGGGGGWGAGIGGWTGGAGKQRVAQQEGEDFSPTPNGNDDDNI